MEEILHKHNISFKPWTTVFSLTGDNCRRFAERHEKILEEVKGIISVNVPSEITTSKGSREFLLSVDIMFEKLTILASLFDSICVVMNDITAQNSDSIEQFDIMCKLFGSIWRKCNLNVTPKVHMVEAHLPDTLKLHGRLGLFNENPIERCHIYNKRWEKMLSNLRKWEDVVLLKNNRANVCMTKAVYDPLENYANFRMRKSGNSKKSHNAHKSYDEIMKLIVDFDQNTQDVDDQFEGLFPPDIQLQDLEGGMEDGDVATEAGVDE